MVQRTERHADEQDVMPGTTLKRRGILAAAGAVVAGMVAKQTSQPVAAATALVIGYNMFPDGQNSQWVGNIVNAGLLDISNSPADRGHGINTASTNGFGIRAGTSAVTDSFGTPLAGAIGTGPGMGVQGINNGASPGIGVQGQTTNGTGVQGRVFVTSTVANTIAVQGLNESTGAGGIGILGQCDVVGGTGAKGVSASGFPMIGVTTTGPNPNAGVLGVGTSGPGVQGQSYAGHGLVGTTAATDGVHAALIGSVQPGSNAIGLRGSVQGGAVGYAGMFDGDVIINGALRVFGSPKNAAVKHPGDGTYRLLYCMESPESWFEDFGRGTLMNGTAAVKLDPDFAALVHADAYLVYLTPEGDCNGLFVTSKTPAGFAVRELKGGASGTGFAWRVVAKRKDITGERLAKVAPPPPMKPVRPFTVPETPASKPPTTKP